MRSDSLVQKTNRTDQDFSRARIESLHGCYVEFLFVGALTKRDLVFGVYIRASDFFSNSHTGLKVGIRDIWRLQLVITGKTQPKVQNRSKAVSWRTFS